MRILHLVLAPRNAGAEILVAELSVRQVAAGHSVAIASLKPAEPDFVMRLSDLSQEGVLVYSPERNHRRLGRMIALTSWIRQFSPDVVLAHSVIPAAYARAARLTRPRLRVVPVMHSEDDFANPVFRYAEKLLSRLSSGLVFVSEKSQRNYLHRFNSTVPMMVIPNGIDVARFRCSPDRRHMLRSRFGLTQDTRVVLQVGRIDHVKQQLLSVAALARLAQRTNDVELWFVGGIEDEGYSARVGAAVESSPLSGLVRFLGSRSDVADLLCLADLFLMPSRHEAHSMAFLEALASGIPIVASRIDAFAFAASQPGVSLVSREDVDAFASEIQRLLELKRRYDRDTHSFTVSETARRYVGYLEGLMPQSGAQSNREA